MDDITFQITLPSGAVATNPTELANLRKFTEPSSGPIVTSDGRVLVPPPATASAADEDASGQDDDDPE